MVPWPRTQCEPKCGARARAAGRAAGHVGPVALAHGLRTAYHPAMRGALLPLQALLLALTALGCDQPGDARARPADAGPAWDEHVAPATPAADAHPLDGAPSADAQRPDAQAPDAQAPDAQAPDAGPLPACVVDVPPIPVRRLSPEAYRETVRALLHLPDATPDLAPDTAPVITLLGAERFAAAARELAQTADLSPGALLPCDPTEIGEDACTLLFLQAFSTAAFRRPVAPEELDLLVELHAGLPAEADFTERLRLMVEIVLQSPPLLYRLEVGEGETDLRLLTDHELAARLAYGYVGGPPDAELTAAADEGRLRDPEELARQTNRLLADPRGRARVRAFFAAWLGLDRLAILSKSAVAWPSFTPALRMAMRRETEALFARAAEGTLRDLFLSTDALVDAALAALYEVPAPAEGEAWAVLNPDQRAGVLTRAAFLSLGAGPEVQSPVQRGAFIRRKLLCLPIPPPPPTVNPVPIVRGGQGDDGTPQTLRAIVDARTSGPDCEGCHALINPIGFTLEHFTAIGSYQTHERGYDRQAGHAYTVAVDARGTVPDSDISGLVEGGVALSRALADSDQVADCLADQWFEWFFERPATQEDACSLATLRRAFRASGGDFRVLVRTTPTLDAFRWLKVAP